MKSRKQSLINRSFDYKLPIIKKVYGYNFSSNCNLNALDEKKIKGKVNLKLNSSFSELSITKIYEHSMSFIHKKPFHRKKMLASTQSFKLNKNTKKVIDLKQKIPIVSNELLDDRICGWEYN